MRIEETGGTGWTLRFGGNRYDLSFSGGELRNTYLGPDFEGDVVVVPDHHQNFDRLRDTRPEAAVFLGSNRDRVFWDTVSADTSDGLLRLVASTPSLRCVLDFHIEDATASLRRCTTITAAGDGDVAITGALSFSLTLGEVVRRTTYLTGRWANETQVRSIAPDDTPLMLESRSGKTGFEYQPYIALETASGTTVVELLWSGNWHLSCRSRRDDCIIAGGLPDAGLRHVLAPGETLELPEVLVVRVAGDLDLATQRLHDVRRKLQVGDIAALPVQFNSWYPFPGDPGIEDMKSLATTAVELGCEVFVLDGGWHINENDTARGDPWQSTGDWITNPRLFPNELEELSDHCHRLNIRFGIWFEPEGIGTPSGLRARHPEWHHWVHGRAPEAEKRAILNLGVPAAREHVLEVMSGIIRRTGATWVKWDFNTDLVSGGWAEGLPETLTRRDPIIAHCEGVYWVQEGLRKAFPELILEMCASGGGRFDGRILRHAHTNWMSDQANPLRNLSIHFGSQRAHPAKTCNDWLIAWPAADHVRHGGSDPDLRGDLLFRLRVAMLGTLGISSKLQRWSEEEIAACRAHIAWFKRYARPTIESGDQYLLTDAPPLDGNGDWAAAWYARKDRSGGVGFAFRLQAAESRRTFSLHGLEAAARYRLVEWGGATREMTGEELAEGVFIEVPEVYGSQAFHIERL